MKPHPIVGIGAGIVTNFFGMEGQPLDGPTPIEVCATALCVAHSHIDTDVARGVALCACTLAHATRVLRLSPRGHPTHTSTGRDR